MAFNGNEGEMIDAATAKKWIDNYQKGLAPDGIQAEFFGFRKLSQLLAQAGSIGLRFYYAKDDQGVSRLIVVAANEDQKNLAPITGGIALADGSDGEILDAGQKCPPYCP
ncbi:MAG: hypothetical protein WDO14_10615 [Bacteroidota bacterium]